MKYLFVLICLTIVCKTYAQSSYELHETQVQFSGYSEVFETFKNSNPELFNNSKILDNISSVEQQIKFIKEEFRTNNNYDFHAKGSDFNIYKDDALQCNLGIVEMKFDSEQKADEFYKHLISVDRSSSKSKVLIRFTIYSNNESIVFIYSDTPNDPCIVNLMSTFKKE